jgi:hypothetical protein
MKKSVTFVLSCIALVAADGVNLLVNTNQNGPIQGHRASNASDVYEYLGIPFAKPPVDSLRFAAPQKWSNPADCPSVFVADKFVSLIYCLRFNSLLTRNSLVGVSNHFSLSANLDAND